MARLDWERARRKDDARPERRHLPVVTHWVIPSTGMPCYECGEKIPDGGWVAYRHKPKQFLCERCTAELGVTALPSKRWLGRLEEAQKEKDGTGRRSPKGKKQSGRRARRSARGN